jgi:hypothetical protein
VGLKGAAGYANPRDVSTVVRESEALSSSRTSAQRSFERQRANAVSE